MSRLPNNPEGFDNALRQLQQHADAALSPATLARLRQARHQASAPAPRTSPWRRGGWMLATACSAVLAVALGLQFSNNSVPPAPTPTVADLAQDDDTLLFDESPELYLWLGSDTLAME